MTIVLTALAAAFAAFCVWLTVRIANRRERWAKWTFATAVVMPALYVASVGPACWITSCTSRMERANSGASALPDVYLPIKWAMAREEGIYDALMSDSLTAALGASVGALTIWMAVQIMNRSRLRAIAAAVALLILLPVLAVNLLRIPQPWNRLDVAKLAMLRVGMPQAEVEGLLGGPPGCYGNPKNNGGFMTLEGFFPGPGYVEELWFDDLERFELYFDGSGQLVAWHRRSSFSRHYQLPPWRLKVHELTGL